jgi:hypothetical protein
MGKDLAFRGSAMSVEQELFVDGHVALEHLRELAERPDDIDDDAVEAIWQHLDTCEDCVEEYEALREGRIAESREQKDGDESSLPPTAVSGTVEADALDPDDLTAAKIKEAQDNGSHINGLMPVGDDPDRNGVPDEYTRDENAVKPPAAEVSPRQVVEDTTDPDQVAESEPREFGEEENPGKIKAEAIEGLITGEVSALDKPIDSLETETALEAGRRIAREALEADDEGEDETEDEAVDEAADEARDETNDVEKQDEVEAPEVVEIDERRPSIDVSLTAEAQPSRPIGRSQADAQPHTIGKRQTATRPSRTVKRSQTAVRATGPTRSPQATKSEPLENVLNNAMAFIRRPRNAIICGAAVALIATAFVLSFSLTESQESNPVAGWAPLDVIETRAPLQEVLVRKIRRGRIPRATGTDVTLDFRGIKELVIAVDLDFIEQKSSRHEVVVRDPEGAVAFHEEIPQFYLDDGRFFLRLVPKQFEMERLYELDLVAHHADGSLLVIAESVFDVLK